MRKMAASLLLLTLLFTACSRAKPQPEGPAVTSPKPQPEGPDLLSVKAPNELSPEELHQGLLRYLNQGQGTVASLLTALYDHWGLRARRIVEADLDSDGQAEVVTALNGGGTLTGLGALFVIYEAQGSVAVDRSTEADLPGVFLLDVSDLAGDSRPEIIWSSTQVGAHTANTRVLISNWTPGKLEMLPGDMVMATARLSRQGKDLVLDGGLVGSSGAGGGQRERTDRYRWVGDAFQLVDRRYADSPHGYHRLQDGIVAETFARTADAESAYRDALEESRQPGNLVTSEEQERFGQAVRTYARFRLGALLLQEGQADQARQALAGGSGPYTGLLRALSGAAGREAGCRAAEAWAGQSPEFLEALNSPFGYANPRWEAADICGGLPWPAALGG